MGELAPEGSANALVECAEYWAAEDCGIELPPVSKKFSCAWAGPKSVLTSVNVVCQPPPDAKWAREPVRLGTALSWLMVYGRPLTVIAPMRCAPELPATE